jgi:hypothetical protein
VSNYVLWNIQILWWGRIGKSISFFSAFTIIAEIIGPQHLKEFGNSLHSRFDFEKTINSIKNRFAALLFIPRLLTELTGPNFRRIGKLLGDRPWTLRKGFNAIKIGFMEPLLWPAIVMREIGRKNSFPNTPPGLVSSMLTLVATVLIFIRVYSSRGFWPSLGYSFLVFVIAGYLAPVLVVSLLASPMFVLLLIDSLVIEPLAWLLERRSLDKLIKLGSFALLLIGFHFDLLAS